VLIGDYEMRRRSRSAILFLTVAILSGVAGKSGEVIWKQKPVFKVYVDTVILKVSVTDPLNRCVTGLSKDDFRIYEDKVQQNISEFQQESSPVSLGILLDSSGSMKNNNNMYSARLALRRLLTVVNRGDEFFLIAFNQKANVLKDFTQDAGAILSEGSLGRPAGRTAIWDAVYRGLDMMKQAKNDKKALILITDGEDNSSRYSSAEVREFAKESDAQIYVIGEPGDLGYGPIEIEEIVRLTGGRAFFPSSLSDMDYYVDLIHSELRNQYVLSYIPTRTEHDGRWRKIQVKLDAIKGMPRLSVRSREGYYAAKY
jgi:Ca-activated chloride channel homolog